MHLPTFGWRDLGKMILWKYFRRATPGDPMPDNKITPVCETCWKHTNRRVILVDGKWICTRCKDMATCEHCGKKANRVTCLPYPPHKAVCGKCLKRLN